MAPEAPPPSTEHHPAAVRTPVAVLVSSFAAVLVVIGLGTLALTQGRNQTQDAGAGDPQPATNVHAVNPGLASLSDLPMIGTRLPGWEIGAAGEEESAEGGGLRTALYYAIVNEDTVFAKLWIRGITEGSVYEADRLLLDEIGAEELIVRGHDARMTVDGNDYDIVWRDAPTAIVHVAVNTEVAAASGRAIALSFADSLVDLTPDMWADHLATAGNSDEPSTPTTSPVITTATQPSPGRRSNRSPSSREARIAVGKLPGGAPSSRWTAAAPAADGNPQVLKNQKKAHRRVFLVEIER